MAENTSGHAGHDGETTIIGSDTHFKGELSFERSARINGRFEGQIAGQGELHVTENATCKADVEATSVHIDGRIEGNLRAKDTVRLNNSGVVKGDIVAARMVMSEGATFFGQCAVGSESAQEGERQSTTREEAEVEQGEDAGSEQAEGEGDDGNNRATPATAGRALGRQGSGQAPGHSPRYNTGGRGPQRR